MDPRLVRPVADLIDEMGFTNRCYDPKTGGGIKSLAAGECEETRTCCGYIDLVHANGTGPAKEIILSAHTNCAAYAAAGHSFGSDQLEDELRFLREEIDRAVKHVTETFPQLRITRKIVFIMDGDNVREIVDF